MGSVGFEKLHVLAVDDSLVDRKVIERLLKISCCKVTAVESGIRALEFLGLDGDEKKMELEFQELKVNLIITDYSMPGMTGFELLKKIKGSSACKEIPVVIMSSENIMTRIDRCLEEGAEDFLMKPVKLSDVERLRDFLIKGEENTKVTEMQSEQVSSEMEKPQLTPSPLPSTTAPALAADAAASVNGVTTAIALPSALPSLFTSSDLSCSFQHLSSPPSSPHWPSKRPRLLNGDK